MTVLFVEHDMDMVRDISDWVIVGPGKIIAEGPEPTAQERRGHQCYLGAQYDVAHRGGRERSWWRPRPSCRRDPRDEQAFPASVNDEFHPTITATAPAGSPPSTDCAIRRGMRAAAVDGWSRYVPEVNILNSTDFYVREGRRESSAERRRQSTLVKLCSPGGPVRLHRRTARHTGPRPTSCRPGVGYVRRPTTVPEPTIEENR
jgi:hypothetical protein